MALNLKPFIYDLRSKVDYYYELDDRGYLIRDNSKMRSGVVTKRVHTNKGNYLVVVSATRIEKVYEYKIRMFDRGE